MGPIASGIMRCLMWGKIVSMAVVYPSWQSSSAPHRDCVVRHLCTPLNKTFYLDSSHTYHTSIAACNLFSSRNIEHVYFIGDSYVRGISAAFYATLNGNHSLFTTKSLKSTEDGKIENICGNKLQISSHLWELNPDVVKKRKSVVFLSVGNHKIGKGLGPRYGVNNASVYKEYIKPFCGDIFYMHKVSNIKNVFWISTHRRMVSYFPDETPEYVESYNVQMREFIESGSCARGIGYIDVYNMSKELVERFPDEATTMSYDKVHYNLELNLIKVQIILSKLMSSL